MTSLAQLQMAFFGMMSVLDGCDDAWIITVFPDNDPRAHSREWIDDQSDTVPVMYMSDELYGMYCASVGMKNENYRGEKK